MGEKVNVFGRKMNHIRKERHITSEQLAELCGVNPGHIRQIESGRRKPSYTLLVDICKNLKVSPNYLMEHELGEVEAFGEEYKSIFQKLQSFTPKQLDVLDGLLETYMKKSGIR